MAPTTRSSTRVRSARVGGIARAYKVFDYCCEQLLQINRRLHELQIRYDRAVRAQNRAFRYSFRLQIATYEGVRDAIYQIGYKRPRPSRRWSKNSSTPIMRPSRLRLNQPRADPANQNGPFQGHQMFKSTSVFIASLQRWSKKPTNQQQKIAKQIRGAAN